MTTRCCAASRRVAPSSARPVAAFWINTGAERARSALVIGGVLDRLQLVAECAGAGRFAMRIERSLVLPDLEHHETVRPPDLLHDFAAQIAVLLAGFVAVLLEQLDAVLVGCCADLNI